MDDLTILETVEIFSDLNIDQIKSIQGVATTKEYEPGETIFAENSPSDEIYIIMGGAVEIKIDPNIVSDTNEGVAPVTIAKLNRGQTFGEIALVDQGIRSASAKATLNGCRALVIERNAFMQLLKSDLEMGFNVISNIAADLCFKIRNSNMRVREALLYGSKLMDN
ncbi:MAG: cyclic nucleotide-binding domain-containing protein [Chloroflexi bacterium]|nr:cyclic nucleotide-binding domain-containing protein [Chloroflexota bacterium]